jgi:3,4-dihydroxy 2-butanone 4-phosphate synthase
MSGSHIPQRIQSRANHAVDRAITAFRAGEPILVHDHEDREGETDLFYPAKSVTPTDVARLRNDAGGLVCVALGHNVAEAWDLPFLGDEVSHPAAGDEHRGYDDRSSFSLTVNHRDTHTGITDEDRALTLSELGTLATAPERVAFADVFQVPGHVHLLRAARNDLDDRHGHTELAVALARAAGQPPAAVVCEMLDDSTGEALSPEAARAYGNKHDIPYVEGTDIIGVLN